jgi:hypothetical protein
MGDETRRRRWAPSVMGALLSIGCVDLELAQPRPGTDEGAPTAGASAAAGASPEGELGAAIGAVSGNPSEDGPGASPSLGAAVTGPSTGAAPLDAGVVNVLGRAPLWSRQVCVKPARESVAGAVCAPPIGGDCWDTTTYDTATRVYARGRIRLCDAGLQVAAYAFGGLDLEADELGADGFFALVEVYDDAGRLLGVVTDATPDDGVGEWRAFPSAANIVVKAYVYAF